MKDIISLIFRSIGSILILIILTSCAEDRSSVKSVQTVGGTVIGLNGNLSLLNNGRDVIDIVADGSFVFSDHIAANETYNVTVAQPPSKQYCAIVNASGTIGSENIKDVIVTCTDNSVAGLYSVGGTISGLNGSIVLQNNGGDDLSLSDDGNFTFTTPLVDGEAYVVSIHTMPSNQTCAMSNASGAIATSNSTNIAILCSAGNNENINTGPFTLGVNVSGLSGSSLILSNNDETELLITENGSFKFSESYTAGSSYQISVNSTSEEITCLLENNTGVLNTDISNIIVTCKPSSYAFKSYGIKSIDPSVVLIPTRITYASTGLPVTSKLNSTQIVVKEDNVEIDPVKSFLNITQVNTRNLTQKLVIAIDISRSITATQLTLVKQQIKALLFNDYGESQLNNNQQIAIVVFDDNAKTLIDFSANAQALSDAIDTISSGSPSTDLAGGISYGVNLMGVETFDIGNISTSTLIVITDGSDTASKTNLSSLDSNDNIYAINIGASENENAALTHIAKGGVFSLSNFGILKNVLQKIKQNAEDYANSLYTISYATSSRQNSHTVEISIKDNPNTASNNKVTESFNANDFSDVSSEVIIENTRSLLGSGDTLALNASSRWTNIASEYTWSASPEGIFAINVNPEDDTLASISVAKGQINNKATITASDVKNGISQSFNLTVANAFPLNVEVVGLNGALVLESNNGSFLEITENGSFSFNNKVTENLLYNVIVTESPTEQHCQLSNSNGVASISMPTIKINCSDKLSRQFIVSVEVLGLRGDLTLLNNATDELLVSQDGYYSFANTYPSIFAYAISIDTQPNDQTCVVRNGTGNIEEQDILILVSCTNNDSDSVGSFMLQKMTPFSDVNESSVFGLPISVMDDTGRAVVNLTAEQFIAKENGQDVTNESYLSLIKSDTVPLTQYTVFAIDVSESMQSEISAIQNKLKALVADMESDGSLPMHKIAIITFDENINTIQEFTSDKLILEVAIDSITLGDTSSNLYGALISSLSMWNNDLELDSSNIGSLIVITDGVDSLGLNTAANVQSALGNKSLYAISTSEATGTQLIENSLLAAKNFFKIDDFSSDLRSAIDSANLETKNFVESLYVIHYASPKRAGSHKLEVAIRGNQNTEALAVVSETFDATGFTSVMPRIVLKDINEGIIQGLQVSSQWTNSDSYYQWQSSNPNLVSINVDPLDSSKVTFDMASSLSSVEIKINVTDASHGLNETYYIYLDSDGNNEFHQNGRQKNRLTVGGSHTCSIDEVNIVCWGDNSLGQINVPVLSNPVSVSAGENHTCALADSGVLCWGSNTDGQTNVPDLIEPVSVSTGSKHSCALDNNGVICWGSNNFGETTVPDLSNPVAVVAGGSHQSCALDDSGVVCWGNNDDGQSTVPTLSNPRILDANTNTCVLDDNGVVCWGDDSFGQSTVPKLVNPTDVSVGNGHVCALDNGGVVCWGDNTSGETSVPALINPTAVSAGKNRTCALDDSGVVCWGDNGQAQSTVPISSVSNPPDSLLQLIPNENTYFSLEGIFLSKKTFSWISNNTSLVSISTSTLSHQIVLTTFPNTEGQTTIVATDNQTNETYTFNVVVNNIKFIGLNTQGELNLALGLENSRPIRILDDGTSTTSYMWSLSSAGQISMSNTSGESTRLTALSGMDETFVLTVQNTDASYSRSINVNINITWFIGVGYDHSCAFVDSGLICWGSDVSGQSNVPLLSNPVVVSASEYHTCAVDDSGVVCWGDDFYGESTVPALSNPITVSAGSRHTCALDDSGVVCWGNDPYGQSTVPNLSNPVSVSAGGLHTCALDDNGVNCWGYNVQGQGTVPALSNPVSVSAGSQHTCALDDSGVVCWGSDLSGQITIPTLSNPVAVSAGFLHTCALDDNGVICWGNDTYGQSNAPVLSNPVSISTGRHHTCALDDSGVVCWGRDQYGQNDFIANTP